MPIPYERIRRALLILLIVLLVALAVLTVVFLATKFASPDEGGLPEAETDVPSAAVDEAVILPETPDAGLAYQDSLIFTGDSLTAHMINRGVLTGSTATTQVWRTESNMFNLKPGMSAQKIIFPGPGTETGAFMTVAEAAALTKPRILIVTLGTDWGVAYLSEEDFKACYTEFVQGIQQASPETTILLQSIFPVTASCRVLTNAQIDLCNKWVKAVAADTGCRYLDTQSVLKDASGCLMAEYCYSPDGIHLGANAYEVILTYIRTHAYTD